MPLWNAMRQEEMMEGIAGIMQNTNTIQTPHRAKYMCYPHGVVQGKRTHHADVDAQLTDMCHDREAQHSWHRHTLTLPMGQRGTSGVLREGGYAQHWHP